jgi:diamine N-acetyltransferase
MRPPVACAELDLRKQATKFEAKPFALKCKQEGIEFGLQLPISNGTANGMTVIYRSASPADAPALSELGATSFVDAFGDLYSKEDLSLFLESAYAPDVIAAEIANPDRVYRLAEEEGCLIGYCKLGLNGGFDHDFGGRRVLDLKQLYLRGGVTGKGLGSALMGWAIREARARNFDVVALSVYSGNHGGQRFYARHGFQKVADTYFMVGNQRDDEYLFALELDKAALTD